MPSVPIPLLAALPLVATALLVETTPQRSKPDFNRDIRPILADRCFTCHGPDDKARKAGLRLDTFAGATKPRKHGQALVPGDPARSLMIQRLRSTDPEHRMPPPEAKLSVTPDEIDLLSRWIEEGGAYGLHWSLVPPADPAPPAVKDADWPRDPLDRFVLARLEAASLTPSPEVDKVTWLRRASFVLTGLGPMPDEVDAFVADTRHDAYTRAADRLLASQRFGERMAQDWLDVARYADTYGYQADVARRVWPYRDWVIGAFNANLPYDRFVVDQLAGDMLPAATRDQRLATTFCRLHRQTNEGGSVEEEYRLEYIADRTETVATAFLGLTLGCARCHDHKFDPLTQVDYYRMTAYFANIDESGLYSHFTPAVPTPALSLPSPEQENSLATQQQQVVALEEQLERLRATAAGSEGFRRWAGTGADARAVATPVGDFPFDAPAGGKVTNRADGKKPGHLADGPKSIEGVRGKALLFDGEDNVSFPGVGAFTRADPFSIALWLRAPPVSERKVVFHRSRAWTDAGSQGYQLLLEDGRLSASLIHFWPGDAIRVKAPAPLPVGEWTHVVMTYDGSSRAAGLKLYAGGAPVPVEVVRDCLTRGITGGGGLRLTIGQRFRDRGLKGGAVDEFTVFDRELTPLEVRHLCDGTALTEAAASDPELARVYAERHDAAVRDARERLRAARVALNRTKDAVPAIMTMHELPRPRPTHLLARGSYLAPQQRVAPGVPQCLAEGGAAPPADRLALARWLVRPDHPLTSRVAVNRLWQVVFGRGLVATPENFGMQGQAPTHPELLDHLARSFVASGWDVKAMLRRLVTSATFRQASSGTPAARAKDPENLLLGRGPGRRLPAEMIRDHVLAASGLLVTTVGGPSVKPYQPAGLWKEKSGQVYRADEGEGLYRRSLYTFWKRTSPPPSMMIFDAAKRDVCIVRRPTTNTPLQALVLLNDPQFVEAARALAEVVMRGGTAPAARIEAAWRRLATRPPAAAEAQVLGELLAQQLERFRGDPTAAAALLKVGKRPVAKGVDAAELAAYTVVCSTLIGADVTIGLR